MLAPGWEQGCPSCSYHGRPHRRHDRAPWRIAMSRSWRSRARRSPRSSASADAWAGSSSGCPRTAATSTTTSASASRRKKWPRASIDYNYGSRPLRVEELPGVSVFCKDDAGEVFHTYSTYGRGVEVMMGTYRMLDLTPKGRDEQAGPHHGMGAPPRPLRAGSAAEDCDRGQLVLHG